MHNWKNIRHRLLPRTLFGRSLMIILVPLLLLQMMVAFIFFDRHWDAMTDKLVQTLAGEIHLVVGDLRAARTDAAVGVIARRAAESLDLAVAVEKGRIDGVARAVPKRLKVFGIDHKLRRALSQRLDGTFMVTGTDRARRFDVLAELPGGRVARIGMPDKRLMSPTAYIFILWMLAGGILLFGLAVAFMRNQIRPIRRLAVAAEKFGKGQDVPAFKPEGATEVRQASRAFLEMKDRLKRQIEQRTAMLAGVSHDLRTPLTRMKLQLAMAKAGAETDNLRQDIDEMEKMIEGYLTFAKGEGGEAPEMTDMRVVLDRVIAGARRQGAEVQESMAGRLMIRVRPIAVERAIANVVSNACKYAKNVWVGAYEQSGMLVIAVDDDGPGIPAELREDVFRPFFRIEKSRNKKTGGIGLGLSIARDVVHAHGGEVFIEDSNRGGVRVVVRLPL